MVPGHRSINDPHYQIPAIPEQKGGPNPFLTMRASHSAVAALGIMALGLGSGYWIGRGPAGFGSDPVQELRTRLDPRRARTLDPSPAGIVKDLASSGIWRTNPQSTDTLARLSSAQLAALAKEIQQDLSHPYQKEMRDVFFRTWAGKDPQAALAFVEGQASSAMKDEMRIGVMNGWAEANLNGFLTWVDSQPDGPVLHQATRIAIPQLVSQDAQAALHLTSRLPAHFRSSAYVDVFSSWILADPAAATGALAKLELPYRDRLAVQTSIAAGWVAKDPEAALAWATTLPAGQQRLDAMTVLAAVWTEKDPDAAIRHAETLAAGEEKRRFMEAIVTSWPPDRISEAYDFASKLPGALDRDSLSITALEAWSQQNPKDALTRVTDLPDSPFRNRAIKALAIQLAATDPKGAIELAQKNLGDGKARKEAIDAAIDGLSQRNPAEAVALITSLPSGQERSDAILTACRTLSNIDPSAGLRLVALLPAGQARNDAAMTLATGMAARDPDAARDWAMTLPQGATRTNALLIVSDSLAELDPAAAARWAISLGNDEGRAQVEERIVNKWAQRDPDAAISWMKQIKDPDVRYRVLASTVEALAYTDPQKGLGLALAEGGTDPAQLHVALGSLVKQWSESHLEEAIAQARQLPSSEIQSSFVGHLLEQISNNNPRHAAEVLSQFGHVPLDLNIVGSVVSNWARQDPGAAAGWVAGFRDKDLRETAVRGVVQEWASQAPGEAGEWLARQPDQGWNDQLMADFVTQIGREQSALARKYAGRIQDPRLRSQALQGVPEP